MSIRLMYITNDIQIAKIAENAGVDWIFVDLEHIGKKDRQANRNTVISAHTVNDVHAIKNVVNKSKLLVRINPLGSWSKNEIEEVISAGADIIMLPFFRSSDQVKKFISLVKGRKQTCLLIETLEAVYNIDDILELKGIDSIHIGLNDLHIERKTTFMFEFLADGSLDKLVNKICKKNITFGFGGMARIGQLIPPAERILTEHYRLCSTGVILSRSFCDYNEFDCYSDFKDYFLSGVNEIREYEKKLLKQGKSFFDKNKITTHKEIFQVANALKEKNQ